MPTAEQIADETPRQREERREAWAELSDDQKQRLRQVLGSTPHDLNCELRGADLLTRSILCDVCRRQVETAGGLPEKIDGTRPTAEAGEHDLAQAIAGQAVSAQPVHGSLPGVTRYERAREAIEAGTTPGVSLDQQRRLDRDHELAQRAQKRHKAGH